MIGVHPENVGVCNLSIIEIFVYNNWKAFTIWFEPMSNMVCGGIYVGNTCISGVFLSPILFWSKVEGRVQRWRKPKNTQHFSASTELSINSRYTNFFQQAANRLVKLVLHEYYTSNYENHVSQMTESSIPQKYREWSEALINFVAMAWKSGNREALNSRDIHNILY